MSARQLGLLGVVRQARLVIGAVAGGAVLGLGACAGEREVITACGTGMTLIPMEVRLGVGYSAAVVARRFSTCDHRRTWVYWRILEPVASVRQVNDSTAMVTALRTGTSLLLANQQADTLARTAARVIVE
jgi:hypothetical protein